MGEALLQNPRIDHSQETVHIQSNSKLLRNARRFIQSDVQVENFEIIRIFNFLTLAILVSIKIFQSTFI